MTVIVLDTNVIVSALVSSGGPPAELVRRWEAGEFEVVTSEALVDEFERVLQYSRVKKYLKSRDEAQVLLNSLKKVTQRSSGEVVEVLTKDISDNRLLECAVAGKAKYIVTGDDQVVELKSYKGITILNPAEFLAVLGKGRSAG